MEKIKHKNLAEGEVTGHVHRALAPDAFVIGDDTERELICPSGTEIGHEEHKTITIPLGDYVVSRQKEIDPDTEEVRVVED